MNIVDVLSIQHQVQQQTEPSNGLQTVITSSNTEITRATTTTVNRSINGKTENFPESTSSPATSSIKYQGFVAVLKENFGFIETIQHDEEVFFHFSNFMGNSNSLELGQEVEYTLSKRNGSNSGNCLPAENVKILPRGSIPQPTVLDAAYNGVVTRPLRCINPDQDEYSGLIQVSFMTDCGIQE